MMFPVEKGDRNDTSVSKIHATKRFGNNYVQSKYMHGQHLSGMATPQQHACLLPT
jgi:hypothetical protein